MSSPASTSSFSASFIRSRLRLLSLDSGDAADSAAKLQALDSMLQRCTADSTSMDATGVNLSLLVHGEASVLSLPKLYRRWARNDSQKEVRARILQLLLDLCSQAAIIPLMRPAQCHTLLSVAFFAIRVEELSRVRERAFELIEALLALNSPVQQQQWMTSGAGDDIGDGQQSLTPKLMIDNLFKELQRTKSHLTNTIRGLVLSTLGTLSARFPDDMRASASRLADTYVRVLQEELETNKPVTPRLVEGCFNGLSSFITQFGGQLTGSRLQVVYRAVAAALHMVDESRYGVLNAATALMTRHADSFKAWMSGEDEVLRLISVLLKACQHSNAKVASMAPAALQSYLTAVADVLVSAEQADSAKKEESQSPDTVSPSNGHSARQKLFRTLVDVFRKKLENKRSVAEISIAIRSLGLLARAIAVFSNQDELGKFLSLLFKASDALFQHTSTLDERDKLHSFFTSLVHSTALVIDQLHHLQPSVLLELRRLASRFFHLYPNLSITQQGRCVTAFTSLLTALHHKHTASFHSLVDTAVHEGLLLTISKLPDYYGSPFASPQQTSTTYSGVERQAYIEYSYLWHHVLGAWVPADERGKGVEYNPVVWNRCLNYPNDAVRLMRRALFNQLMSDVLRVMQQLDVSLQPVQPTDNQSADTAAASATDTAVSSSSPSSTSSSGSSASTASLYGNDVSSQLEPSVPKDYQLFLNLVDFIERFFQPPVPSPITTTLSASPAASSVSTSAYSLYLSRLPTSLPSSSRRCLVHLSRWFVGWLFRFGSSLVQLSTRHPLVSGFYKLAQLTIAIADHHRYFSSMDKQAAIKAEAAREAEDGKAPADGEVVTADEMEAVNGSPQDDNRQFVCDLFRHYLDDVFHRMAPFTAELLFACIRLLLTTPTTLCPLAHLVPPLQRALQLGISYRPAAELAIDTLERWSRTAQDDTAQQLNSHLPAILPLVQDFLRLPHSHSSAGESEAGGSAASDDTLVDAALLYRLLDLLGSFGNNAKLAIQPHRTTTANSDTTSSTSSLSPSSSDLIAWTTLECITYPLPFSRKLDVHLDSLLPRLSHLALHSTSRQIKTAAGESLHAIIIYMIAKAASDPNKSNAGDNANPATTNYEQLYVHLFPVIIRLACDTEVVTSQVFSPLLTQLIHWYTNRETTYKREMRALLDALCEYVGHADDSALRQRCAAALADFFLWSNKHSAAGQSAVDGDGVDANIRALFKRLFALCRHPSPHKRLGASLTFNSMYRQLREHSALVERYALHILYNLLQSMQLAAGDNDSTASKDDCALAIDRYMHIILEPTTAYHKSLRKKAQRDGPPECQSLDAFIGYCLHNVSRHEEEFRRQCQAAVIALAALSQHARNGSRTSYVQWWTTHKQAEARAVAAAADADDELLAALSQWNGDNKLIALAERVELVDGAETRLVDVPQWVEHLLTTSASIDTAMHLDQQPTVDELTQSNAQKHESLSRWFDSLSASLDCYQWFLSFEVADVSALLASPFAHLKPALLHFSQLVRHFSSFTSTTTSSAATSSSTSPVSANLLSGVQDQQRSIILRLLRLLHTGLSRSSASSPSLSLLSLLDDSVVHLLWLSLLQPECIGFDLIAERQVKNVQTTAGLLATTLCSLLFPSQPSSTSSRSQSSHLASVADTALSSLRSVLSSPSCRAVFLTNSSLSRQAGLMSVRMEAYRQLWSSGWLMQALGSGQCNQLAKQLLMETYRLPGHCFMQSPKDNLPDIVDTGGDGVVVEGAMSDSPIVQHVGHQMLHLALHMGVQHSDLLHCIVSSRTSQTQQTVVKRERNDSDVMDVDGSAVNASLADSAADGANGETERESLSSAFYRTYRSLLNSYLASHWSDYCRPLLRAAFTSMELLPLVFAIGEYVAQRKERKARGRAIATQLAADGIDAVSDADAEASTFVAELLKHAASSYFNASNPSQQQSTEDLEGSQTELSSPTSADSVVVINAGRKPSAKHRSVVPDAPITHPSPARGKVSLKWRTDRELALQLLQLLDCILALDSQRVLDSTQPSHQFFVDIVICSLGPDAPLPVKRYAVSLLPPLLSAPRSSLVSNELERTLLSAITSLLHAPPFPLYSTDLTAGSTEWRDCTIMLDALLDAMVRSKKFTLLQSLLPKLSEKNHAYKVPILRAIRALLIAVNEVGKPEQPRQLADECIQFFMQSDLTDRPRVMARCFVADSVLAPLLRIAPLSVVRSFFDAHLMSIWLPIKALEEGLPRYSSGEAAELEVSVFECHYALLEVLFQRLSKEHFTSLFERLCAEAGDKEAISTKKILSGAHKHVSVLRDVPGLQLQPFRLTAYATMIAALLATQQQPKFFRTLVLFAAHGGGGGNGERQDDSQLAWSKIIDVQATWTFEIDTNFKAIQAGLKDLLAFKQASRQRGSRVRAAERAEEGDDEDWDSQYTSASQSEEGMSRYLSSQYLADSSLSQDAADLFASDRRSLSSQSQADSGSVEGSGERRRARVEELTANVSSASVEGGQDVDVVLAQPALPLLLTVLSWLDEKYGREARDMSQNFRFMPVWMEPLWQALVGEEIEWEDGRNLQRAKGWRRIKDWKPQPINVRWAIAKLLVVKWDIFQPWAPFWWRPLVELVLLPAAANVSSSGGVGFHYFLRDICVTLLRWDVKPADTAAERQLASRFVNHLLAVSIDHGRLSAGKRAKLRSNLQIVRLFVASWKDRMQLDKGIIVQHLKREIVKGRTGGGALDVRNVGVQLLAIVVSNGLPAFDPRNDGPADREEEMVRALVDTMASERKVLYEPAAEVYGLVLSSNLRLGRDNAVWMSRLLDFIKRQRAEQKWSLMLDVLVKVAQHAHQLGLVNSDLATQLCQLPYFANELQDKTMQLLLWAAPNVREDLYDKLRTNGWLHRILSGGGEGRAQELTLLILLRQMDAISLQQLRTLVPELMAAFDSHPSDTCRELYFKLLVYLYQQHVDTSPLCAAHSNDPLVSQVTGALVCGLNDSSAALRSALFTFFDRQLPADLPERMLELLTAFHRPDTTSVSHWLSAVVSLLLQRVFDSADFDRPISDVPLPRVQVHCHGHRRGRAVQHTAAIHSALLDQCTDPSWGFGR